MDEAEPARSDGVRPADRAIMEFLRDERPEYPAIIANRTGMHAPYVERRCETLVDRGLIEAVSGEVVYRLTCEGETYLDTGTLPD